MQSPATVWAKSPIEVDRLQRVHRSLVRHQRAKHMLQRRALDDRVRQQGQYVRRAQELTERRAEVRERVDRGEEPGSALSAAGAALASCEKEAEARTAELEEHSFALHSLTERQFAERSKLGFNLANELRQASAPAAAAAPAVAAAATAAATPAGLPGSGSAGGPAPSPSASEGAGAGDVSTAAAQDAVTVDALPPPAASNAAPATSSSRPKPASSSSGGGGAGAAYFGLRVCQRCGTHCSRSESQATCSECNRELCGRGGRGPAYPVAWPCVELLRCNCGSVQCYDCFSGAEQRGSAFWRSCYRCNSFMCARECEGKNSECRACGQQLICKGCRGAHDKVCAAGGEAASESEA